MRRGLRAGGGGGGSCEKEREGRGIAKEGWGGADSTKRVGGGSPQRERPKENTEKCVASYGAILVDIRKRKGEPTHR